jgi:molybdopterin-containing oxidoreductase family membrane subunit
MNLRSKPLSMAYYLLLMIIIIAGFYAIYVRATEGLSVTALTSLVVWGAWVSWYIFFIGVSAGAFLLSSLVYVFNMKKYEPMGRDALLIAAISMILALLFVWIDIARLERGLFVIMYRNFTSILSWEIHFYLIYVILLIVELYFAMRVDLVKMSKSSKIYRLLSLGSRDTSEKSISRDKRTLRVLGAIAIPIALAVHGGTGALFSGVKARIYWFSPLVPVIFIVSALVSGTALLIFFKYMRDKTSGREIDKELYLSLGKLLLFFLFVDMFFLFWEYFSGFYGLIPDHLAILNIIMTGNYSWVFWIVQIGLGVALPIILIAYSSKTKSVLGIIIGSIFVTLGIAALRHNLVIPALAIPVIEGMPTQAIYFPTLIEWMSSFGLIALGLLLYSIGTRVLPMDKKGDL